VLVTKRLKAFSRLTRKEGVDLLSGRDMDYQGEARRAKIKSIVYEGSLIRREGCKKRKGVTYGEVGILDKKC